MVTPQLREAALDLARDARRWRQLCAWMAASGFEVDLQDDDGSTLLTPFMDFIDDMEELVGDVDATTEQWNAIWFNSPLVSEHLRARCLREEDGE